MHWIIQQISPFYNCICHMLNFCPISSTNDAKFDWKRPREPIENHIHINWMSMIEMIENDQIENAQIWIDGTRNKSDARHAYLVLILFYCVRLYQIPIQIIFLRYILNSCSKTRFIVFGVLCICVATTALLYDSIRNERWSRWKTIHSNYLEYVVWFFISFSMWFMNAF